MRCFQRRLLFCALFLSLCPIDSGFYVPGVAPKEFHDGDPIEVKAIKLTSVKTVVPYEYYALPFCRPVGELHYKSENLGEVMRGDRIVNTPYEIFMRKDTKCSTQCPGNTKALSISKADSALLRQRITEDYHVHLLVDNLPCATKYIIPETKEVFYDHGYKLGWTDGGRVFVNNHLEIVLMYHQPTPGVYRVVGFEVQPKSIAKPKYTFDESNKCTLGDSTEPQEVLDGENEIVWSYSVRWEESEVPWASRWDVYLNMKDVQIHWFSILNSIIVIACLTGFLSVIIVRTVRRDIAKYNRDEEADDALEETGWKLVHGDVFRPPKHAMLLVNFVGTGIQLAGSAAVTVILAMLGMLSPASRGSLTTVAVFLYCFMGLIAGYHAGRLYKTLRGNKPKRCAFRTAVLFPAIILGIGFFLNFFLIGKHSSGAIPFTTMLALLALWGGIDLPLLFLGFHFGFRKQIYTHPVRTNQIPRQVPDQPWYLKTFPCMLLAGILPFGAVFIELYFIFSAIWENQFYYLFGFLFIVLGILFISCSQIAIVVTYFLLCAENYHWWWKSFAISGGSALYVMAYSVFYYYTKLNIIGFVPTLLYFSYSFLIALTFWMLTGTIGFYAAYFFLRRIYGAVKID
ncbi:Endosomal P24A protein precursor [Aphelenchoides avenae]|nr:Endosomal P24A protein precursor [Aphelenchus avenae]